MTLAEADRFDMMRRAPRVAIRMAMKRAGVEVRCDEDGELLEIVLVPRGPYGPSGRRT